MSEKDFDQESPAEADFSCTISIGCSICGSTRTCTRADTLHYLKHGWPSCCGETMMVFFTED